MQIDCRLLLVAALGAVTLSASAAAPKFSNLYVFGDSYCDVGNVSIATQGARPGPLYYQGRFSNGPLWVDHIAGYLGLKLAPALAGGTDWAFAGAWVTAPEDGVPTVPQQVQMYLNSTGGKADPNALYFLDGGGNDIVGTTSGDPNALGYQIATGIADSELTLRRAGARHFIIPNLFNVGLLPVAADHVQFAAAASASANQWLTKLLWFDQKLPTIQILRVDVNSLMNAVQTDQSHFGFVNVASPCLVATDTSVSICDDPDHTFFWDIYHPTVFGHAFFAVVIENALAQSN
jgi:phospholipase/lecithinase/hemolysin